MPQTKKKDATANKVKTQQNTDSKDGQKSESTVEHSHLIAQAINKFLHRARDIEVAAVTHIPISVKRRKQKYSDIVKTFDEADSLSKQKNRASEIVKITKTIEAFRKYERLEQSNVPEVLEISLFLGLFSCFDAFTGNLLKAIYSKKPELFNKMNRNVPLSDVLKFNSFEEMKNSILLNEIENFRRYRTI
jgi:hypothetical protein